MRKGKRATDNIYKKINYSSSKSKKSNKKKLIYVISIVIIILIVLYLANDLIIIDNKTKTGLVINNNNVTENVKNDILIEDDVIYLSEPDIKNFFDKYIYEEENSNKIITTYDKKIAEIGFDDNTININGSDKKTYAHAKKVNNIIYLPISEMKDVYGIEIENIESTNIITIDSTDREQIKYTVNSDSSVRYSTDFFSVTIDRVKKGDSVVKVKDYQNGWIKIRTQNGKLGYIKNNKLTNEITVRQNMDEEKQINGKVNIVWDYFSQYGSAPNRSGSKIDGANVVSPAFFYIDENGIFHENIGDNGKAYIDWAHNNGYKVWPMVSNAEAGIEITSKIMNSYENRKKLEDLLTEECVKYDLDGINIDFENMKESDKDLFSRFIIEVTPRIREIGAVLSVDVTAPDGGETWSMCFDRNVIGDVANYIVFMAYDEYGSSSNKAGTTAGYDWVKLSLDKFLTTEEINSEKIILAIPFYSRLWTIAQDGSISNKAVYMKDYSSIIPNNANKQWDETLKQFYYEYQENNTTKKIWIEDENSLKAKISLITDNNLAGVGCWAKDMEEENVWNLIKNSLE